MSFLEVYTASTEIARCGVSAEIKKDGNGDFGAIQIEAPADRNIFILSVNLEGKSPGAYCEVRGSDTITGYIVIHPLNTGEFGGIPHTAVAKSGITTVPPDGDSLYIPTEADKKSAVTHYFQFPLLVQAGSFFRMVSIEDKEDVRYCVEWVEIPVKQ